MASFTRSVKTPLLLSSMAATRRPGLPGRSLSNMSNASDLSSAPPSPGDFNADDIMFSTRPSPTPQGGLWPEASLRKSSVIHLEISEIGTSPTSVSRPIAIELPTIKKTTPNSSSSVYTPPAPLSARGDLPGGYFPLHEEQNRVYRSHPFHLDVSKARERSHRRASETCSLDSLPPPPAPPVTGPAPPPAGVPSFFKMTAQVSAPPPTAASNDSSAHTPVVSYTPSGTNANPLPVGKYYPSNYESRQPEQQFQPHRPSGSPSGALKSDPQLPTLRSDGPAAYARQESEAKRRLQQYQRDMIAHATFALNGGNVNAAALNAITMRNIGFTSVSTKPSKPNIVPLGSPGPVTPLALDTVDDGYLGVRARNSEDHPPKEEVTRAIRAEEERCRREGVSSPALSPVF